MRTLMLLTLCLAFATAPAMATGDLSPQGPPAPRDNGDDLLCLVDGTCPFCPPFLDYPCLPP